MKTAVKIILVSVLVGLAGCNPNEIFEKELYKKVIGILSDDNLVFTAEYDLNVENAQGSISVYCGGTNALEKDVFVEIEFDDELLAEYNRIQYDTVSVEFAKQLSADRFEIPELSTVLRANDSKSYSTIDIKLNHQGLSPDSLYMIPLRIKSVSDFEINEEKRRVLYNVKIKNDFAQQKVTTYYKMKGLRTFELEPDKPRPVSADKVFSPISKNKVRTLVGTHNFSGKKASLEEIDEYGIMLEIHSDSTLTIHPCGSAEVEMLGNSEDNRYELKNNSQVFHLYYEYYGYSEQNNRFMWITMQETLTRQGDTN